MNVTLPEVTALRKPYVTRTNVPRRNLSRMDEGWRHCEGSWDRLQWARRQANFERAKDAADSMGIKEGTYRAYERPPHSSKHTPLDHLQATRFAKKFRVNWVWLLTGEGAPDRTPDAELQVFANKVAGSLGEIEDMAERERAELLIWNVVETFRKRA